MLEWDLSEGFIPGIAQFNLEIEPNSDGDIRRGRFPAQLSAFRVKPGKAADLIGLSRHSLYAVSPTFVAAASGLTGLAFGAVDMRDGPQDYAVLGVTGTCGSVDYRRAIKVRPRGEHLVRRRGIVVEHPQADTDFAMPDNNDSILLSSRAADQLAAAKLSNLSLERMADVEFDIPLRLLT